ncbi:MAG: tryptophan--tRNA ligase [Candidatus Aenigmatarchaeota archaeon]
MTGNCMDDNIKLDPWANVEVKDYEKVFAEFGVERVTEDMKNKVKHLFFQRGLVVGHRDTAMIMKSIEQKKPFYCLTGIACSGPLHIGHKTIIDSVLMFKKLGAKTFFVAADLDGYLSRPKVKSMEEAYDYAIDNLAHALALGVLEKDVYIQSRMPSRYYEFAFEISKKITPAEFEAIYGTAELGKISAVILQIADILHPQLKAFGKPMPGIIPVGLDQDPHIRLTRDICSRTPYNFVPPSGLYLAHEPGLREGTKMSSSHPETAIFLSDKPEDAKKKISRALTGGGNNLDEQRKFGGNPDICKVYAILKFHDTNEKEIQRIFKECKEGKWFCGECKKYAGEFIEDFLKKHQAKLKKTRKIAEKMLKR